MKKIKYLSLILIVVFAGYVFSACEKDNDPQVVKYMITGLKDNYNVAYLNENGETIAKEIAPGNDDYVWSYSFRGDEGDLLYLYAAFTDKPLDHMKFKFYILIDGKIYKDAYGYDKSQGDTLFYIKRQGTVAYNW